MWSTFILKIESIYHLDIFNLDLQAMVEVAVIVMGLKLPL